MVMAALQPDVVTEGKTNDVGAAGANGTARSVPSVMPAPSPAPALTYASELDEETHLAY